MIDWSVENISFYMIRKEKTNMYEAPLLEGFYFRFYKEEDEKNWASIETSVSEFEKEEDAMKYFNKNFLPYKKDLYNRMVFLCNEKDEAVGTITAWWGDSIKNENMPCLHWLAIKPKYQGLGLGKSLVSNCIKRMIELDGDVEFYLSTQTPSYKAVGIYKKAGFNIYKGLLKNKKNEYLKVIKILDDLSFM